MIFNPCSSTRTTRLQANKLATILLQGLKFMQPPTFLVPVVDLATKPVPLHNLPRFQTPFTVIRFCQSIKLLSNLVLPTLLCVILFNWFSAKELEYLNGWRLESLQWIQVSLPPRIFDKRPLVIHLIQKLWLGLIGTQLLLFPLVRLACLDLLFDFQWVLEN